MKLTRYFIALLFAVSLLASAVHPAAASTSSETAAKCLQYHTVERGEYLSLIAYQYVGLTWRISMTCQTPVAFSPDRFCASFRKPAAAL
jgi:hypothetical protein